MPGSRRREAAISLMLIFVLSAFLSAYVWLSLKDMRTLQLANSGFLTDRAMALHVPADTPVSAQDIEKQMAKGTYLFQKQADDPDVLYFYAVGADTAFPIVDGRGFRLSKDDQRTAQVMRGKAATYLPPNSVQVATLGIGEPSLMDYQAFVLPALAHRTVLTGGTWLCDGSGDVSGSARRIASLIGDGCTLSPAAHTGLYRMTALSDTFLKVLCLVLICCILACVPMMNHFVDASLYERQFFERMGFSAFTQWRFFVGPVILLAACTFSLGGPAAALALGKAPFAHASFLLSESLLGVMGAGALHAVLFLTGSPTYPWSEKKQ